MGSPSRLASDTPKWQEDTEYRLRGYHALGKNRADFGGKMGVITALDRSSLFLKGLRNSEKFQKLEEVYNILPILLH